MTCEAVNETTGAFFPVSQDRDQIAWNNVTVNLILDNALDDCMADPSFATLADEHPIPCIAATPSCSFRTGSKTIYKRNILRQKGPLGPLLREFRRAA